MADHYGYPPLEKQFCGNCRYAIELPKRHDEVMRCARHAPQVLATECRRTDDPATVWGHWPAVLPDLWCGEWGPRDGGACG
jgi:hypothetical protein